MSKQKIFTIAGVVLLVILVIVAFSFKGKYDDASALLVAAQADAADQKKAADAEIESLGKQNEEAQAQLAALQAELDAANASVAELTASKDAAEKQAADYAADIQKAADALNGETAARAAVEAELKITAEAATETEAQLEAALTAAADAKAALAEMTGQYNKAYADLQAKITRYNIVRESHAKLAEKYDQLAAELKSLAEAEVIEPERYESLCGVSFVIPEGAEIGTESSKMVEILLADSTRIKLNISEGRVNVLWYGAEPEAVNAFVATLKIK